MDSPARGVRDGVTLSEQSGSPRSTATSAELPEYTPAEGDNADDAIRCDSSKDDGAEAGDWENTPTPEDLRQDHPLHGVRTTAHFLPAHVLSTAGTSALANRCRHAGGDSSTHRQSVISSDDEAGRGSEILAPAGGQPPAIRITASTLATGISSMPKQGSGVGVLDPTYRTKPHAEANASLSGSWDSTTTGNTDASVRQNKLRAPATVSPMARWTTVSGTRRTTRRTTTRRR